MQRSRDGRGYIRGYKNVLFLMNTQWRRIKRSTEKIIRLTHKPPKVRQR